MRDQVEALGLDFDATHAVSSIYRAANAVRAHVTNKVLHQYDLSWTGFVVMWVVWIAERIETRHAAEASAISKGTLTGVVKTLEAHGWIEKSACTEDRRLVELSLTSEGTALMQEVYPKFNAVESEVVSGLSRRRVKDLTNSLRAIVTDIEEAALPRSPHDPTP